MPHVTRTFVGSRPTLQTIVAIQHTTYIRSVGVDDCEFLLDPTALIKSEFLSVVRPDTDAELADYLAFASEIDDVAIDQLSGAGGGGRRPLEV